MIEGGDRHREKERGGRMRKAALLSVEKKQPDFCYSH